MVTTRAALEPRQGTIEEGDLPQAEAAFADVRQRLQGIACRILGSRDGAEDIVQDAWVRWQICDRTQVRNPTAFLVAMTTRLAINAATSARARRECSVGTWLVEPVDASDDPIVGIERTEALAFGILQLFERLSPMERAAYVLRQAFDYPYATIAGVLQLTEANTRQLVSRASRRLASDRRRPVSTADRQRLVKAFVAAARGGDVAELETVLAA